MTVKWLPKNEIDRLEELRVADKSRVDRMDQEIASGETGGHPYKRKFQSYLNLGVIAWLLDEDAAAAVSMFYESGVNVRHQFDINGKDISSEDAINAMNVSLASADWTLIRSIASIVLDTDQYTVGHPTTKCYAGALKYILLGDESKSRQYLSELPGMTRKQPFQYLGDCYTSLLDGDARRVDREFEKFLKWFRKKNGTPISKKIFTQPQGWHETNFIPFEFLISLDGIAFCNLAASRGIKLDVDERFLPRQLLLSTSL